MKTQWSMSASLIMPALYFSATTVPSLWATILPVPNHVLPTSGTARFFSPLSVDSFVKKKKSSFIYYTEDALRKDAEDVVRFAETEGLTAHANSIKVRFDMK